MNYELKLSQEDIANEIDMLDRITFCDEVVVVDSHFQRIVLATEETTVTQQVTHIYQMPSPLVVMKSYEGQRVMSW